MALRDLLIRVGHDIDLSGLEEAQEMIDDYRSSYIELEQHMVNTGEVGVDTMESVTRSAHDTGRAVRDLGDTGKQAGDDINREFSETETVLKGVGDAGVSAFTLIAGAAAAVGGAWSTGAIFGAARDLEVARLRLKAFAGTDDELQRLNRTIEETIAMSQGIHREGELAEAAHAALIFGMEMDTVSDIIDDVAIVAATRGDDISAIMRQVGKAVESGTIESMKEAGLISKDVLTEQEQLLGQSISQWDRYTRQQFVVAQIQGYAASKMGWYNDYLETADAKTRSLSGAMGDLAESSGELLLPVADIASATAGWLDDLADVDRDLLSLGVSAGLVGTTIVGATAAIAHFAPAMLGAAGTLTTAGTIIAGSAAALILWEDNLKTLLGLPSLGTDIQDRIAEAAGIDAEILYPLRGPGGYVAEYLGFKESSTAAPVTPTVTNRSNSPRFESHVHINVDGNVAGSPGIESQMRRIAETVFRPMQEREWRKLGSQLNSNRVY